MWPDLIRLDFFGVLQEPLVIRTYGVLLTLGFLAGIHMAARCAEQEGESLEQVLDMGFYLLLFGLLGARLMYIVTAWPAFAHDPWELLRVWRGGLVWYGGFLGALGYLVWAYGPQGKFFKIVDILTPFTALGHSVGRVGCLMAGCCHGSPVGPHEHGIVFPHGSMAYFEQLEKHLIAPGAPCLPVYPTQVWESSFEFGLFVLLMAVRPFKRYHGQLFLTWLLFYSIGRSVIEAFRGDSIRGVLVFSTSQYISMVLGATALVMMWRFRGKNKSATAYPQQHKLA